MTIVHRCRAAKPSTKAPIHATSAASLSLAVATTFSLIVATQTLACTPGSGSAVVEAPMLSADASASSIALVTGEPIRPPNSASPAVDAPFKPGDRMTGFYTCNQGKTAMVLIFEEVAPTVASLLAGGTDDENAAATLDVEAVFEFHYDGTRPGFPKTDGSARMRGKYEPKTRRLRLKGEEWIDQPANYSLITLTGSINKSGQYSGTVEGYGCTTFSAIPERP